MARAWASRRLHCWYRPLSGRFSGGLIGLVLSSPLTVCLVMLGRYMPQLEFLAVILGDEPRSTPESAFTKDCSRETRTRPRTSSASIWRPGRMRLFMMKC